MPYKYNNPIIATSALILELNEFFKHKDETIFAIGYVNGSGSTNVIPNNVNLMGTFRALNEDYRIKSHDDIKIIIEKVSKDYNTKIDLEIRKGYPALHNDEEFTKKQIFNARKYLGEENVVDLPIRMTAEDFSYFANTLPSCFYRLGTGNKKKGIVYGLHTSKFDIDEDSLKIGMGMMAYLAISS
jgi:metal-dependent amidase/aminoacylase/carboxypeptidase family protein